MVGHRHTNIGQKLALQTHLEEKQGVIALNRTRGVHIFRVSANNAIPVKNCRVNKDVATCGTWIISPIAAAHVLNGINRETVLVTLLNLQIVIEFVQSQNGIGRRVVVVFEIVEIAVTMVRAV